MKMTVSQKVYSYSTKYKEGFLYEELEAIAKEYPKINMDKFWSALRGNTCIMKPEGLVIYHCDVETAINCGLQNRERNEEEFD